MDSEGPYRRGAGWARVALRQLRRRHFARARRSDERCVSRRAIPRGDWTHSISHHFSASPSGVIRRARMKLFLGGILLAVGFAALPLFTQRNDFLNLGVQIFLAVALAQSWNLLGGYAGQITLGHAAFFGLGALVTRTLWVGGAPLFLALPAGALVATAFGVLIGAPAFRLRGAYFAVGTLALAEILRITVGNLMPQISTIPSAALASYSIIPRYYLTFALSVFCVAVVALLVRSRIGLGMQAVREDEAAAEASGEGQGSVCVQRRYRQRLQHVKPAWNKSPFFFSDKLCGLFDNLFGLPYKLLSLDEREGFIMRKFCIRFLAVVVAATMFCSLQLFSGAPASAQSTPFYQVNTFRIIVGF